ncbi:MAG: helix-turn-helix domain-containing protein, partial [Candidatus Kryptonium sp.]
ITMKLYKISEVAKLFNVSKMTVKKWIKEGKLRVVRIGNVVRVEEKDLFDFIESQKINVKSAYQIAEEIKSTIKI